jgi:uncharacterized protein
MSEFIDNHTQRQAKLKQMIGQLHDGKTVDEVKPLFADLLAQVDGTEIAMLEQALMDDGMPEGEIKRLCDVHVAAFQEALDAAAARPGANRPAAAPVAHPLETLRAENAAAAKVADALESDIYHAHWDEARATLLELRQLERHYRNKENILFPYLEKHSFTGPTKVMWSIHDDIRAGWKKLGAALAGTPEPVRVAEVSAPLLRAVRDMFYKEENILFPTALELLGEAEWSAIQQQFRDGPAGEGEPAAPAEPAEPAALAGPGLIPLQVGALTAAQIGLMLTHLPVDVTFVDENDTVRFFSATPDRIFERTPAIIGRQVQQCHPPSSVHRVQRILDDFRAGRRDDAEFWIQMGPPPAKFIHIRYFALRDAQRRYQGCIEVTQDVTAIRALEGERRLVEEGL